MSLNKQNKLLILFNHLTKGKGPKAILARGGLSSFIVKSLGVLLTFILNIVLARTLGAKEYGIYVLSFSWIALLGILATVGLDIAIIRFVPTYNKQKKWALLKGIILKSRQISILSSTIIAILSILIALALRNHINRDLEYTFLTGCVLLPLYVIVRINQAIFRGFKKIILALTPESVGHPLLLICIAILFYSYYPSALKASYMMIVTVIIYLIISVITFIILNRILPYNIEEITPSFKTSDWIKVAIPLFLISGLYIILSRTDIVMVGAIKNAKASGCYSVASNVSAFVAFGLLSINSILAPMISEYHGMGDKKSLQGLITTASLIITAFSIPVAIFLVVCGKWILQLFGTAFLTAYPALVILIIGQTISSLIGSVGYIMIMTGHQNAAAKIVLVGAIGNILLNCILIPIWGMNGAAVATTISTIWWNVAMYIFVKKRLHIEPTIYGYIKNKGSKCVE